MKELIVELGLTPVSSHVFQEALKWCEGLDREAEGVLDAKQLFIRYRQSRQGIGKEFGTLSRSRTRRGMNEQVSAWLGSIDGMPDACERLQRVVLLKEECL